MITRCRVIIPYFGVFQKSIIPFLKSCGRNTELEWLFFSDTEFPRGEVPNNVYTVRCTLNDIKKRIENKLGFQVALDAPYKLCDFRPAFGLIFEQELQGYDFWGWGDVDLVYGDLSHFITDDLLHHYDKIYPCGHLSLIRNTPEINRAFMLEVPDTLDYRRVFTDPKSFIFDEYKGLNEKLMATGKQVYGKIDFADIDVVYHHRFRTADWKTIRKVFPDFLFRQYIPENYRNQVFFVENGKAYRAFDSNGKIEKTELAYIHYRHKIPCEIAIQESKPLYMTIEGFIQVCDDLSLNLIKTLNGYPGRRIEFREYMKFYKERMVMKLGSNTALRNFVRVLKGKERLR